MYRPIKRFLDLVFSLLVLIILGIPMLVIAMLVRRDGGPAFYRGKRSGLHGKVFDMLKYRSMVLNADKIGPSSTSDDDPRITKVGKYIRKYKLDELPQFINVLKGEMSVVGPRPQVVWVTDLYTPEERKLLDVRPGITDWASLWVRDEGAVLEGSKDPDADYDVIIAPTKIKLGLEYAKNMSFLNDMKIVFATAMVAFLKRDSSWALPPGTPPSPEPGAARKLATEAHV